MGCRPVIETWAQEVEHTHADGTRCVTRKPALVATCGAFDIAWMPPPASAWAITGRAWMAWPAVRETTEYGFSECGPAGRV